MLPLAPGAAVLAGLLEGGAVAGDVAHPGRGELVATAVDALGVLAAGHLQRVRRAGKAHGGGGPGAAELQRHAPAADEVRRAREHVDGGDPRGERPLERGILRPDRVQAPDLCGHRVGHLVPIAMGIGVGHRVDAHVRVGVDDPRRHVAAADVHHLGALGHVHFGRGADREEATVAEDDHALLVAIAGGGVDRPADEGHQGRVDRLRLTATRLPGKRRRGRLGERLARATRRLGAAAGDGRHQCQDSELGGHRPGACLRAAPDGTPPYSAASSSPSPARSTTMPTSSPKVGVGTTA